MSSVMARALLGLLSGSALCGAAHADRPEIGAYLDLKQVAESQLSGTGDDVTYSEIGGAVTAQIKNRRIVASGSYRLAYRIPERGDIGESVSQDGLLRLRGTVIEDWLTIDGGAIITRSRIDPSGAAPQLNTGKRTNLAQTYSVYIQPSIAHQIGDVGFSANYRYGYTTNESGQTGVTLGPVTDRFDSSKAQQAAFSVGMEQSALPFDWTLSSSYQHENTTNLAEHYRSLSVIGELKLPVAGTLALVASGGYERTRTSERGALTDPLTGIPILGKGGRFIVDPASPRVLTYDLDGIVADGGIIWKPSRRTRIEARAGYRYGSLSITGLVEMKPSERSGLVLIVTDKIQSFGQDVSGGLAGAPVDLDLGQSLDPSTSYQNCLFGVQAGSGRCIGGALGQASANAYRERAANLIFSRDMRLWSLYSSFGYARRTYIDNPASVVSLDGVVDENFFGNITINRRLGRVAGVSFSFAGSLFKNGQLGASDVKSGSINTNYYRTFGRGIRAQATVGLDASKQDGVTADVSGRAQLGLQYQF